MSEPPRKDPHYRKTHTTKSDATREKPSRILSPSELTLLAVTALQDDMSMHRRATMGGKDCETL